MKNLFTYNLPCIKLIKWRRSQKCGSHFQRIIHMNFRGNSGLYSFFPADSFHALLWALLLFMFISSCSGLNSKSKQLWKNGDFDPPSFVSVKQRDINTIVISLTESTDMAKGYIHLYEIDFTDSALDLDSQQTLPVEVNVEGPSILLNTKQDLKKGHPYVIEAHLFDLHGNSTTLVLEFYGINDSIPLTRINEVVTEGSKTKGDKIELVFLSGGNLAGMSIQEGVHGEASMRIVFPEIKVEEGDFLVTHLRPNPELTNIQYEYMSKDESSHAQAIPEAWDYFVAENKSIPNSHGLLVLKQNPYGDILDAFVYTTRDDSPQNPERGFPNTQFFEEITALATAQQWISSNTDRALLPSDAVNPKDSTTTRSIARNSLSDDTNTKNDWHITPTSGATFGFTNTNDAYTP